VKSIISVGIQFRVVLFNGSPYQTTVPMILQTHNMKTHIERGVS